MTDGAVTLRQWVGRRVRELRQEHGQTQDEVARVARDHGFQWSQSKVAELERGEKGLPAEELVLLPLVLARAGCGTPSFSDLIPDGAGQVVLGPRTTVPAAVLGQLLRGDVEHVKIMALDTPETRGVREVRDWARSKEGGQAIRAAARGGERVEAVSPDHSVAEARQARLAAGHDAERAAARRFGMPAFELAVTALATWGRGLTEERDGRVEAKVGDRGQRAVQALRGHVTRELYRELQPAVDRWRAVADVHEREDG